MTQVEQLATFVTQARYEDLSEQARQHLKIRVLDALGCAIGAMEGPPLKMLRAQLEDFGGTPLATLIGGGKTAPDRAAFAGIEQIGARQHGEADDDPDQIVDRLR